MPGHFSPKLVDAAGGGSLSRVRQYLEAGADPNSRNHMGETALHLCIRDAPDASAMLELLLEAGVDVDAGVIYPDDLDEHGQTSLMRACFLDAFRDEPQMLDCISRLLAAGADPNRRDALGRTVLMHCARWARSGPAARLLIEAGADLEAVDLGGNTALVYAHCWRDREGSRSRDEFEKALRQAGVREEGLLNWRLREAVFGRAVGASTSDLMAAGASPNYVDPEGCPVTTLAVTCGHIVPLQRLLNAGADPNCEHLPRFWCQLPLHQAIVQGDLNVVKRLLAAGASPNRLVKGESALTLAHRGNHRDIAHLLAVNGGLTTRQVCRGAEVGEDDAQQVVLVRAPLETVAEMFARQRQVSSWQRDVAPHSMSCPEEAGVLVYQFTSHPWTLIDGVGPTKAREPWLATQEAMALSQALSTQVIHLWFNGYEHSSGFLELTHHVYDRGREVERFAFREGGRRPSDIIQYTSELYPVDVFAIGEVESFVSQRFEALDAYMPHYGIRRYYRSRDHFPGHDFDRVDCPRMDWMAIDRAPKSLEG